VGGVSQEATEQDFKHFFMQFGRVIDATLMMDKDTGRPRGFGFVTFDGDAAVDAALAQPLEILGKPIEVKRAQPRGNMHDEEQKAGKFGRNAKFAHQGGGGQPSFEGQQNQSQTGQVQNGMTPTMMAQYWARMQAYFAAAQANLAAQQGAMTNPMMGGGMNPMQQMMAMQAMQRNQSMSPTGGTPNPQNQGNPNMGGPNGQMNPNMMNQIPTGPASAAAFQGAAAAAAAANAARPGFNAQEQLMFEQQKYQVQEAQARQRQYYGGAYPNNGPSTWDGMYDDVPQPNIPGPHMGAGPGQGPMRGAMGGRGPHRGGMSRNGPQQTPSNAPANAPTGPKNAGKPGANYRGGGRGGHRGFHPYARNG